MTLDPVSLTPVTGQAVPEHTEPELTEYFFEREPVSQPPSDLPHFSHAVLFFVLAVPTLIVGEALSLFLIKLTHLLGDKSYRSLYELMASDARLAIPTQVLTYALLAIAAIIVFQALWQQPFAQGIHWNFQIAQSKFIQLVLLGLGVGFGITMLGNYLPMPSDPPIMRDMMGSQLGAWMMLIFGITCAPLLEELAFRGFLLPGLIHGLRWLMQRDILSPEALSWATIPLAVLFTTIPFALLHSTQVSHAWAPLLLIGIVSVALCVVRLRLNSVAASAVVHASYNFTLFAGLLLQTGGFRHLERLSS